MDLRRRDAFKLAATELLAALGRIRRHPADDEGALYFGVRLELQSLCGPAISGLKQPLGSLEL